MLCFRYGIKNKFSPASSMELKEKIYASLIQSFENPLPFHQADEIKLAWHPPRR
jgi:hypothetical protein